ncbi:MAG: hypothetical protein WBC51_00675 [Vicinamibacterales bacterium]
MLKPSSEQSICGGADPPSTTVPLFGLGSTDIDSDAYLETVRVKASRFLRRKAFTMTMPASRPNGCERGYYQPCNESGGMTMKLTFAPVRRK